MITYPTPPTTIIYPEGDGELVSESDDHRDLMWTLIFALKNLLCNTAAYVSGNLCIHFEEDNPTAVVTPDVFVVFGIPQRNRRTYRTWEHAGKGPDLVIELTSSKTRYEDLGTKRVIYAELGVQEYYICDPLGDYLNPRLRGYQLIDGELVPMSGPRIFSRLLNVELQVSGSTLRLTDLTTRVLMPTPDEEHAAHLAADSETKRLRAENEHLHAEIARLRAEIERLRANHE